MAWRMLTKMMIGRRDEDDGVGDVVVMEVTRGDSEGLRVTRTTVSAVTVILVTVTVKGMFMPLFLMRIFLKLGC